MLLAPAAYVVVFETARVGLQGPTVDLPQLTVVGLSVWAGVRGVLGLLVVAPMVVGARWGLEMPPGTGSAAAGGSAGRQVSPSWSPASRWLEWQR